MNNLIFCALTNTSANTNTLHMMLFLFFYSFFTFIAYRNGNVQRRNVIKW